MGEVITIDNINGGNKNNSNEWSYVEFDKKGNPYPIKVWQNLECVLNRNNIKIKYNEISKEEEIIGLNVKGNNSMLTEIVSLQTIEGLKMNKDLVIDSLSRISTQNSYNPFIDMLEANDNENLEIIKEVFNCIEINPEYADNIDYYSSIFVKWCIGVVQMAHNSFEKDYSCQGILVLQGGQGCYKSTFSRKLMPNNKWFKGDKSLDPNSKDSVAENTKYILVEWGELDSTLKGEQAKLKQYITAPNDEYRKPYQAKSEKYPRITSYIGTVNKKDFLKDETGSRRFWIIPVKKCNIDKLNEIDMNEFWGAVYNLWKSNKIEYFLNPEENAVLESLNKEFNYQNDISITLDEKIDWTMDEELWSVYNITELAEYLGIKEKKSLKIELEKRGIEYKNNRMNTGKTKKGFKLPRFELRVY